MLEIFVEDPIKVQWKKVLDKVRKNYYVKIRKYKVRDQRKKLKKLFIKKCDNTINLSNVWCN